MDLSQRKMSLGGGAGKRGRYGRSVPDRLIEDETEAWTGGPGRTALPIAVRTLPVPDEIDPALPNEECAQHLPVRRGAHRESAWRLCGLARPHARDSFERRSGHDRVQPQCDLPVRQ